ncbi:MAG: 6-bladed beta-propeller [Bacteroidota bacterium]|nr:6-bladed beta-propeller [Bacteroidota bacterium]
MNFRLVAVSFFVLLLVAMPGRGVAQELDVVDIGAVFNETIPLNLSEIASGIEYIPLETSETCILGSVYNLRIHGDNIVLISNRKVYLFNTNGKFIRKLGDQGKGPGEYVWARDIQIHPNGESVFILDITGVKIIEIALDGRHLRSIKLPKLQMPEDFLFSNDHFYVLCGRGGSSENFVYEMDDQGVLVRSLNITCEAFGTALHGFFQETGGFLLHDNYFDLATVWNDTIFRIHSSGRKEALYLVDYGKFKYPLDGAKGSLVNQAMKKGYAFQHWRAISENYLFIHSQDGRDLKLVVYDRNKKKIIHSSNIRDEKNGGIQNNFDGGPGVNMIPAFQKNNGKDLVQAHQAIHFIETSNENLSEGKPIENKKAQENLKQLVSQLSEDDNPVVQIIHLK